MYHFNDIVPPSIYPFEEAISVERIPNGSMATIISILMKMPQFQVQTDRKHECIDTYTTLNTRQSSSILIPFGGVPRICMQGNGNRCSNCMFQYYIIVPIKEPTSQ